MIREAFKEQYASKEGTIYSDPTTNNLYALFKHDRSVLWVAEAEDEIPGSCGVYPTEGSG